MTTDGKNGRNGNNGRPRSSLDDRILVPRGDDQVLHSLHKAEVVFDLTFRFVHRFFTRGDRTVDLMVQAARSGKKNIFEGSQAASTSKETELKLTNVARAHDPSPPQPARPGNRQTPRSITPIRPIPPRIAGQAGWLVSRAESRA